MFKNLNILIILSCLISTTASAEDDLYFIQASAINLRSGPSIQSNMMVKIPIATPVTIVIYNDGNTWVKIHDKYNGYVGWTKPNLIGKTKPTSLLLWQQYTEIKDTSSKDKQILLERILALDPTNIEALEALYEILINLNRTKYAQSIKQDIEYIKDPSALEERPATVAIYTDNTITPIALIKNNEINRTWNNQVELDQFLSRYLRSGSKYYLYMAGQEIGSSTISIGDKVGSIDLSMCYSAPQAKLNPIKQVVSKEDFVIASSKPLKTSKNTTGRELVNANNELIDRITLDLVSKHRWYNKYDLSKIDQRTTKGITKDINGDGIPETLVVRRFVVPYDKKTDADMFSFYSFLVLGKGKNDESKVLFSHLTGGRGQLVTYDFELKGLQDINNDGIDEIFIFSSGYEYSGITVYESIDDSFRESKAGSFSGC